MAVLVLTQGEGDDVYRCSCSGADLMALTLSRSSVFLRPSATSRGAASRSLVQVSASVEP